MCATQKPQNNASLRLIFIPTFCLSIALSIPYAVAFGRAAPAIGIIVTFFSGFLSLISVPWHKQLNKLLRRSPYEYRIVLGGDEEDNDPPTKSPLNLRVLFLLDFLLALFSLLVFILATVEMANSWHGEGNILGTYTTLVYILNFGVHAYLAFVELVAIVRESRKRGLTNCPHCRKSLIGAASMKDAADSEDRGDRGTRMSGGSAPLLVAQVE